ncbi:hypothetical protein CDAR_96681 [Caerostris darwini]|uniref:Uncharacterized protein n=1 Tax=Caerostris darwini TaxID=1538125 RepID=A0AAV4QTR3_9ARAC|nr:hypothetical protein CDAR_96681 [Caerostris darwini]
MGDSFRVRTRLLGVAVGEKKCQSSTSEGDKKRYLGVFYRLMRKDGLIAPELILGPGCVWGCRVCDFEWLIGLFLSRVYGRKEAMMDCSCSIDYRYRVLADQELFV